MEQGHKYQAVVIGTSAGGLFALTAILEKLPENFTLPVIIVQHRSKEPKNLLEEILQNKCKIKIKQVDEKEPIEKGTVYVAPPDYHLLIESDLTFSLTVDDPVSYSRPSIDVLFESAANVYKDKLIAIILTGANSDGASGIKAVAKHGGLVIVQNPAEADFSFMPNASIETKKVKHIFTLSEIGDFLLNKNKA